ncbi:hypothetical protein H920_05818 [Fukomys damarensis]|uniref:Uncharacterized protein n=1 Tax=Fukomys damarensis TaxID=885580 RepID=A0A091EBX4_FUKDA|nr:hypothetical protein H920_05818 [Fukomys damarensis]
MYKRGISVAWADDKGFEESTAPENQCRGEECPKDKTKHPKGKLDGPVKLLNTFQSFDLNDEEIQKDDNKNHEKLLRKKKDEDCDFLELTMVEDLRLSSSLSAQLTQEQEVRPESPMCKPSGNTDVSPFPELPATPKGHEHAEGSLLVGQALRWLHQTAVSMGRRRWGPEQATRSCPQQAPHRNRCLRDKRVHPDGPPGQLGPRIPTFSLYMLPHHEKFED